MCREGKIDFNLYEFFDDGNVYSKSKEMFLSNNNAHPYVINEFVTVDGRDTFYRHRVIWYYFNGDIPEDMQVDHKNGDKTDNRLCNLRLLTPYDNTHNPATYINFLNAVRTEEHRKNISERQKGKKMSEDCYKKCEPTMFKNGHNVSDEIKKKISEANSKPIVQLTLNGEFISEHKSARNAEKLGLGKNGDISKCCNGGYFDKGRNKFVNIRQSGGFKWMYKEDYEKMLGESNS